MKVSPSVTLALILSAGMAGAAAAQTSATQGAPGAPPQWNSRHPGSSYAQPPAGYGQAQPAGTAAAANPAEPMQPTTQAEAGATSQVREAQQRLKAAGLYNGPIDGVMDPDTRMAIARFQEQRGLRRSETLDQETQAALMSGGTAGYGASTPGAAAPGAKAPRAGATGYGTTESGGTTAPSSGMSPATPPAGGAGSTAGQAAAPRY